MGLEAKCKAIVNGRTVSGKALLETKVLTFRGGGEKLDIPHDPGMDARVEGGDLVIAHGGVSVRFVLGDAAPKWLAKIKNPKSVIEKLGIKPGQHVLLLSVSDDSFASELEAKGAEVSTSARAKDGSFDHVFLGVETRAALSKIEGAKAKMKQDGAVWLLRPKGKKEITEADGMAAGKAAGLVDVKVVAFSSTHTAEKFVIRVADRK